jgi:hypothetical protein
MTKLLFATLTRHRNVELHFLAIHSRHLYLRHFQPKEATLAQGNALVKVEVEKWQPESLLLFVIQNSR